MRQLAGIVVHRTENPADYACYHRVIDRRGRILFQHHDSEIAAHAIEFNPTTLAVALVGDFATAEPGTNWSPTPAQMMRLKLLCKAWRDAYGPLWVAGHSELGPSATRFPEKLCMGHECPGTRLDLDALRAALGAPRFALAS